ncbi:MAG TPA: prepilin-type N-terminal cleavage/methylation domain-containing protein [Terrimesophilobacter sp.]|uniref:PilW family protein n=1 Tax=Terrimesophilobacter sp. TaxID=2906435 RepID=UPI002F94D3FE
MTERSRDADTTSFDESGNLHSEQGFTLIELLAYCLLIGLVLAIVGGMMFSTMTTSKTVVSVDDASTAGQLVSKSVVKGIRNSSDFRLTSPTGTDQFLVARTVGGAATPTWMCSAWYYSAAGDGSVRYKISPSAILPPTAAQLQTWTLLGTGVKPVAGTGIFSALDDQVSISFLGKAGDHPPVRITSSATSRAGASGSLTCY